MMNYLLVCYIGNLFEKKNHLLGNHLNILSLYFLNLFDYLYQLNHFDS